MSTQKKNNRRKALAVGLAILGVAGLSLASAAQLNLTGGSQDLIQAGTTDLSANLCQVDDIVATFTLDENVPGDLTVGTDFGYVEGVDALLLSGINDDDAADGGCADKIMKVALGNADDESLGEVTRTVDAATETIALTDFAAGIVAANITQISVTIY